MPISKLKLLQNNKNSTYSKVEFNDLISEFNIKINIINGKLSKKIMNNQGKTIIIPSLSI
jgi:hypothetical protein